MNEQEFIKSIVDAIESGYDFSRGDLQAYVEAYVTEKYRNLPFQNRWEIEDRILKKIDCHFCS